jgi:preprotein translocase subunit SecB
MAENTATIKRNITINAQYVKDFSFESPNAPFSLTSKETPSINLGVDVQISTLQDSVYEVSLVIRAEAKAKENLMFLAELTYAGAFTLNVSDEERDGVLLVYCPNILFPFARRIIADATRDGGFPPLMLDPVDFTRLFQQHIEKAKKEKEAQSS